MCTGVQNKAFICGYRWNIRIRISKQTWKDFNKKVWVFNSLHSVCVLLQISTKRQPNPM